MAKFFVNGEQVDFRASSDTPLLWALRDHLGLTGTKYGCGMSLCGACTVHLDGAAIRSCVTPVSAVEGKRVTTIEGIGNTPLAAHAVQSAWIGKDVVAVRLLPVGPDDVAPWRCSTKNPRPTDADIDAAMAGNLCRCGTYQRIRAGDPRRRRDAAQIVRGPR